MSGMVLLSEPGPLRSTFVLYCADVHRHMCTGSDRRRPTYPSQQATGGMGCSASIPAPQHPAVSGSQPSSAATPRSAQPQKPLNGWSEEVCGFLQQQQQCRGQACAETVACTPFEPERVLAAFTNCRCAHGMLRTQEVESWMRGLHANLSQHAPALLPASGKLLAAWDDQVPAACHASTHACRTYASGLCRVMHQADAVLWVVCTCSAAGGRRGLQRLPSQAAAHSKGWGS